MQVENICQRLTEEWLRPPLIALLLPATACESAWPALEGLSDKVVMLGYAGGQVVSMYIYIYCVTFIRLIDIIYTICQPLHHYETVVEGLRPKSNRIVISIACDSSALRLRGGGTCVVAGLVMSFSNSCPYST